MDKSILGLAQIKIKLTNRKDRIARVDLNWNDEFEVRFFRITRRSNGTLWFQPPALREHGWAKCFGVINPKHWHSLKEKVMSQFFECLEKESIFDKDFINQLKEANSEERIKLDEIPDSFT